MLIGTVVVFLLVGVGVYLVVQKFAQELPLPTPIARACEIKTTSGTVLLDPAQTANAATIAAVGIRRKVPDRAVVVALATAMQESKLENLEGGDRDSIGLFQQRPSQGWGQPQQIIDPRYSARKFYDALLKVRGWQRMSITDAAQSVQRSAYPQAYQQWADQATVLARTFTSASPAALTCAFPPPTKAAEPRVVARQLSAEVPVSLLGATGRVGELRPANWTTANWLIAHADRLGIEAVTVAGQRWHRADGWSRDSAAATADRVRFEMASIQPAPPA